MAHKRPNVTNPVEPNTEPCHTGAWSSLSRHKDLSTGRKSSSCSSINQVDEFTMPDFVKRNYSTEEPSIMSTKNQEYFCVVPDCSKPITNSVKAIQCSFCDSWYCLNCSKLTSKLYDTLSKSHHVANIWWTCDACLHHLPTFRRMTSSIEELKQRQDQTDIQLKVLEDKLMSMNQVL